MMTSPDRLVGARPSAANGKTEGRIVGVSAALLFLVMLGLLALSDRGDPSMTASVAWVDDGQQQIH
jgi:hypothetical protein